MLFNGNLYTSYYRDGKSVQQDTLKEAFEKKHDVDFVRDHLHDYVLADIFSPEVLREVKTQMDQLPWYIQESIPQSLVKIMASESEAEWLRLLQEHYTQQAIDSLRYCADCDTPYSKDPRVFQVRRDLLSSAGHAVLADLTENKLPVSAESLDKVMSVANKFLVPCRLFKPLQDFSFLFQGNEACDISLTSGCYNRCVHCGIDAQPLVSHMPFPVAKQIIWYLRDQGIINQKLFFDSDPLAYRSPAFGGVDMGDIYGMYPAHISVTKGILCKKDEVVLAKIARQSTVDFSLVDIVGENVARNVKRFEKSLEIVSSIEDNPHSFSVIVYQSEGKQSAIVQKFIDEFPNKYKADKLVYQDILPVGRAINLEGRSDENKTSRFYSGGLVICADGSVYDVYGVENESNHLPLANDKRGRQGTFAFQYLGNICTTLSDYSVAQRHPTCYQNGVVPPVVVPIHRRICSQVRQNTDVNPAKLK